MTNKNATSPVCKSIFSTCLLRVCGVPLHAFVIVIFTKLLACLILVCPVGEKLHSNKYMTHHYYTNNRASLIAACTLEAAAAASIACFCYKLFFPEYISYKNVFVIGFEEERKGVMASPHNKMLLPCPYILKSEHMLLKVFE